MKDNMIYLDNSATTQVSKEVYEAMKPYYTSKYYNPDSTYYQAREVKAEVEKVRSLIAEQINADPDEIFFTSGGCEANTWAMKIFHDKGYKEVMTSPIEHHSIHNAIQEYIGEPLYAPMYHGDLIKEILQQSDGISNGQINSEEFEFLIKKISVQGVSIMQGNNEIGTIQDIGLLCDISKEYNIAFHTDAVQTFMHIPIDVEDLGVDMLSASAHKIGGPKGVGFLYIKRSYQNGVRPLICGGQQEQGLRGGTTNVPGIIGFGKAIEIMKDKYKINSFTNTNTKNIIESALLNASGLDVMFTGSFTKRLPNHISMCFRDVNGQELVSLLAEKGIMCSTGSACSSGNPKPSHVLKAINIPEQFINGAIRLTYPSDLTEKDINRVVAAIEECLYLLRKRGLNAS